MKKMAKWKIVLAIFVLVVTAGFIALKIFQSSSFRSVLNKYCKALESGNGENVLEVYQPEYIAVLAGAHGADIEEEKNTLAEENQNLCNIISDDCGKNFKASYKIIGIEQYDDVRLGLLSEELGDTDKVSVAYMITLQFQASGKEGSYYGKIQMVHAYHLGNKWYMMFDGEKFK